MIGDVSCYSCGVGSALPYLKSPNTRSLIDRSLVIEGGYCRLDALDRPQPFVWSDANSLDSEAYRADNTESSWRNCQIIRLRG